MLRGLLQLEDGSSDSHQTLHGVGSYLIMKHEVTFGKEISNPIHTWLDFASNKLFYIKSKITD